MKKSLALFVLIILSTTHLSAQDWNLIWSDEFEGTTLNASNWTYDTGTGSAQGLTGWGNNELQYYRNGTSNIDVSGGVLSIIAKEESFGGSDYTSARIKSAGLQAWNQGKIEARIKLPIGQGIWPAFWMLRDDPFSDPNAQFFWPGEIDIVETVGHQPSTVYGTAHYGVPSSVLSNGASYTLGSGTVSSDYHTYSLEWYEELIVWKLDGIQYHSLHINDVSPNHWLFNQEYFALLNVAVGGNWPGSPDASTVFPVQMDVDYVRVYTLNSTVESTTFNVDMRCYTEPFSSVGLVGPSEVLGNWCGDCVQLTDFDLDSIWTVTLDLPSGDFEYKYNIDNWAGQEQLVDDMVNGGTCAPVTDFNEYANRLVSITVGAVFDDTFGSCEVCIPGEISGCTEPEAVNYNSEATVDNGLCEFAITFEVDMNEVQFPFITPEVNGLFNGWCGICNPLTDDDGNGIWTTTINLVTGITEFKFSVDDWTNQEELVEGAVGTNTTDGFTNRILNVSGNMTYGPILWNASPSCPGDINGDGMVGTSDFLEFNSNFGSSCGDCPSDLNDDGEVNVLDFIIFNSFFGITCY